MWQPRAHSAAVPIDTASAPSAIALTTSEEFLIPPDAMTETRSLILSSLSLWSTTAMAS